MSFDVSKLSKDERVALRGRAFDNAIAALNVAASTFDLAGDRCTCCGRQSFRAIADYRMFQAVSAMVKRIEKLARGES